MASTLSAEQFYSICQKDLTIAISELISLLDTAETNLEINGLNLLEYAVGKFDLHIIELLCKYNYKIIHVDMITGARNEDIKILLIYNAINTRSIIKTMNMSVISYVIVNHPHVINLLNEIDYCAIYCNFTWCSGDYLLRAIRFDWIIPPSELIKGEKYNAFTYNMLVGLYSFIFNYRK
jgi:hypothetical protein